MIGSNTVEKCDVALSRAIKPYTHPTDYTNKKRELLQKENITERFFLLLYEIGGEQVRGNFHQSGCSKVQVKISRQIARVETEPVIHHAGHAPVKKREIK